MDFEESGPTRSSMIHQICMGADFNNHLVDSKDSKLLLDLTEYLIQTQVSSLIYMTIKIVQRRNSLVEAKHTVYV